MKELIKLLKIKNHDQVIKWFESKINVNNYITLKSKDSSIYIPRNINKRLPALCAHTDTVFDKKPTEYTLDISYPIIKSSDKSRGIGADDRVGVYMLAKLANKVPAVLCLFDQEETGCIGSGNFNATMIEQYVSCWIGLDRRGYKDIATYGYDNDELQKFIKKIGFKEVMGSITDVSELASQTDIACINFSVGYYHEHTPREFLNFDQIKNTLLKVVEYIELLEDKKYEADYFDAYTSYYNYRGTKYYRNKREVEDYRQSYLLDDILDRCPKCGKYEFDPSMDICYACGYQATEYIECPLCGEYNYEFDEVCRNCNTSLHEPKEIEGYCPICKRVMKVNLYEPFKCKDCGTDLEEIPY